MEHFNSTRTRNAGQEPVVFAQDDIKLRPNVTVNLGVRVEVHGGMSEVKNHIGGFDPTLTNPVTNTPGSIWFAGLNGARTKSFETKTIAMPAWIRVASLEQLGGAGWSWQYSACGAWTL